MATTDTDKKSLMDELTAEERKFVLQQRLIQILANVRVPSSPDVAELRRGRATVPSSAPRSVCSAFSPPVCSVRTLYLRSAPSSAPRSVCPAFSPRLLR